MSYPACSDAEAVSFAEHGYLVVEDAVDADELREAEERCQPILDEMSRNLIAKFGFTPDDAAELELRLVEYLPRALIEVRRRDTQVVAKVEMDAKDRHVVAAALSAKATVW